jgi:hypothetical protein
MGNEMDLMQRLAVSKKIMEKAEQIKTGSVDSRKFNIPEVQEYEPVNAKYNLPQEYLAESTQQTSYHDPSKPLDNDRVMSSKLPDEIKRLMIENPIVQPTNVNGSATISEEVIQGAQRLMNMGKTNISDLPNKNVSEKISETEPKTNYTTSNININEIKNMIRDVVRDTVRDVVREELKQAGMIVESTSNSNETIQFKVGQHLFIGKVTKIKKLEK